MARKSPAPRRRSQRAPAPPPAPREPRRSTLQQERSRQSRAALLDAATRLWSERGVDEVKVEEICDEAGVSKGLFYFYFATKEDLLVELAMARDDEVAAAVDAAIEADEPVDEVVRRGIGVTTRLAQRAPRHLLVRSVTEWLSAIDRHASLHDGHVLLGDAYARAFRHGRDRGEIADDHAPEELGATLAWAALQAQVEWATSTRRQPALNRRLWSRAELVLRGAGWRG
jgi:AcrR family transcriptional regulator